MELTLLNNDKLKILLTKKDRDFYNISFITLNYNTKKNKDIIKNVIEIAKRETGFDPCGHRLLIEAFPEKDGDISLYLTKLSEKENNPENIFLFRSKDDLLDFINATKNISPCFTDIELYAKNNLYYLRFLKCLENDSEYVKFRHIICEFAEDYSNMITKERLKEFSDICLKNFLPLVSDTN